MKRYGEFYSLGRPKIAISRFICRSKIGSLKKMATSVDCWARVKSRRHLNFLSSVVFSISAKSFRANNDESWFETKRSHRRGKIFLIKKFFGNGKFRFRFSFSFRNLPKIFNNSFLHPEISSNWILKLGAIQSLSSHLSLSLSLSHTRTLTNALTHTRIFSFPNQRKQFLSLSLSLWVPLSHPLSQF